MLHYKTLLLMTFGTILVIIKMQLGFNNLAVFGTPAAVLTSLQVFLTSIL